jgi:RNA polymerase sigma factor (sigma-70 family)
VTEPRSDSVPLWEGVREGDPDAFVSLYDELANAVFGFCLRRTGSWHLAEDCTSLVFLEAWRLRTTLRSTSSGTAWLFGIANNVVRNSTRARRRHRELLRRMPLDDVDHGFETAANERLDAASHLGEVLDALRRLPAQDQEVISLAAGSELTTDEIAQILRIPPGTVKSRLSRARRRLSGPQLGASTEGATTASQLDEIETGAQR